MEDLVFSSSELEELEEIDKQVAEQLNEEGNDIEIENQTHTEMQDNTEQDGNEEQENLGEYQDGYQEQGYQEQGYQEQLVQQPEQECVAMPYQKPPENVTLYGAKLPSSLLLQPIPFDPDLYVVDTNPVILKNEAGKPVVAKTTHNAVRWRNSVDDFGDTVRESNSRVVTWSDGSMSLFVGKECYDIAPSDYRDFRDIYVRQRAEASSESFLQCHGVLSKKLAFNPTNIEQWRTDTMNFRKAVQKGVKQGSKLVANTQGFADPEEDKRAKEILEDRRAELKEKFTGKSRKDKVEPFNEAFLEDDDNDETGSSTRRSFDPHKERENENRIMAAKKNKRRREISDSEEINEGSYDEDNLFGEEDDEEEYSSKKRR
jgi:RNA polymerase-associated protein LEO1